MLDQDNASRTSQMPQRLSSLEVASDQKEWLCLTQRTLDCFAILIVLVSVLSLNRFHLCVGGFEAFVAAFFAATWRVLKQNAAWTLYMLGPAMQDSAAVLST